MNSPMPSSNRQRGCLLIAAVLFFVYSGAVSQVVISNSPALLHTTTQKQNRLELTLSSDAIGGISALNTPVKFEAKITNAGNQVASGVLNWSVKSTTSPLPPSPKMATEVDAGKTESFAHTITIPKAGFVEMVCVFTPSGAEKPIRQTLRIGCNPDKVISPLTRQPDFDEF